MNPLLFSIISWIGMILILTSYFLLSSKRVNSHSVIYNSLNLLGGIGIVISTFYTRSWPAMTLNIIWSGIAVITLIKIKKQKRR